MGPIFSWIKFCSSRTNRQSTKVLSVILKNRLPYLPYLLSSWGIPVFKHKGTWSSNAWLQKRKSTTSSGFTGLPTNRTGPKLSFANSPNLTPQHRTPENRHWTNGTAERRGHHMLVSPGSPVCTSCWNWSHQSLAPAEEAVTEGH